jgi:hypothetical protein
MNVWRNKEDPLLSWSTDANFGQSQGSIDAASLIDSNFGSPGQIYAVLLRPTRKGRRRVGWPGPRSDARPRGREGLGQKPATCVRMLCGRAGKPSQTRRLWLKLGWGCSLAGLLAAFRF